MIDLIEAYNRNAGGGGSKKIANVGFANIKKLQPLSSRKIVQKRADDEQERIMAEIQREINEVAAQYIGAPNNHETTARMLDHINRAARAINPCVEITGIPNKEIGTLDLSATLAYPPEIKVSGMLRMDEETERESANAIDLIAEYNKIHMAPMDRPVNTSAYTLPRVNVSITDEALFEMPSVYSDVVSHIGRQMAEEMDRAVLRAITDSTEGLIEDDEEYTRIYSEREMRAMPFRLNARSYNGAFSMEVRREIEPLFSMGSRSSVMHVPTGRSYTLMARDMYGVSTFLAFTGDKVRISLYNSFENFSEAFVIRMGRDGHIYEEQPNNTYRRFDDQRLNAFGNDTIMASIIEVSTSDLWFTRTGFEHLTNFNIN